MRFYGLPIWEPDLLALPWRTLRALVLGLFGVAESLTGATFARLHSPKEAP